MTGIVKLGCNPDVVVLPIDSILLLRSVPDAVKRSNKYQQIAISIAELGIIEPLVVAEQTAAVAGYLLLDGHMRHAVLKDQGATEVRCLVAIDDEAYTYNKRINRLATIQEHFMIVRALDRGVSEERLAKVLNLDVRAIRRRRSLLAGVCPEVVELLKDKAINPSTFESLRRMKPLRQIETAALMTAAGNYSGTYARALLAATRQHDLTNPEQPKRVAGMTISQMSRMEREMDTVQQDLKGVEARYGEDVLQLVIASAYVGRLLKCASILSYLTQHHFEILGQLQAIVAATSLEQVTPVPD